MRDPLRGLLYDVDLLKVDDGRQNSTSGENWIRKFLGKSIYF